jgi:hypothetical protein
MVEQVSEVNIIPNARVRFRLSGEVAGALKACTGFMAKRNSKRSIDHKLRTFVLCPCFALLTSPWHHRSHQAHSIE